MKGGLIIRLMSGLRKPKRSVPGVDVAGVVEAVGRDVKEFRPGDQVFGGRAGALAGFVLGRERNFAPKPANISFEQAAAIAIAGCTALQGLRDKGQLQPGQKVLINGAAGGVGTFAVQIARALGGEVTGVCSARNLDLVRSLGADHVIDYAKEDFSQSGQRYDLILDLVGNRSLSDLRRVLKPEGTLVLSGGGHEGGHGTSGLRPLVMMGKGQITTRFVNHRIVNFLASVKKEDLIALKDLIEAGKLTPVVDRTNPMSEVSEAFQYLAAGHARGKVVVTVSGDGPC
jgi:NADPH:quinone reductase-like Zn-dependent oxidoreductase